MSSELLKLDVDGMSCAACVSAVERIVNKSDVVSAVAVNLPLRSANIQLNRPANDEIIQQLIGAINKGGFSASRHDDDASLRMRMQNQVAFDRQRAVLALILSLPTIYLTMFAKDMGTFAGFDARLLGALLMTMPVYFWSGWPFHVNAWKALRRGVANMDVLIHIGTTVAFFWSVAVTLADRFTNMPDIFTQAEHVFFDGVIFIIGFVLLGNYLEASAKLRATDAIHSLMKLQPKEARLVIEDDYTEMRPSIIIKPQSLIKVLTGETIPIDGVLEDCQASIDESTMTGEAYPIRKQAGEEVFAGTIVLDGTVFIRTSKPADNSLISNIIKLVEDAQTGKAPIQRLVDKISAIFVPTIVLLALVGGIFWAAIGHSWIDNPMNSGFELALMVIISTLVIACPCALGLATPIALVVGTGVGAKHGLLIKGIDALESVHKTDIMVVDKTGTVTLGKPRVSHIEIIDCEVKELLCIAAALEQESTHPLSAAIIKSWSNVTDESYSINDIRTIPGMGMVGEYDGSVAAAGNQELMADVGALFTQDIEDRILRSTSKGVSVVFVALGQRLLGWFEFSDLIRDTSPLAVKRAKQIGLEVVMLTGDNANSANTIAEQVGIKRVIANVKPEQKADQIRALQAEGRKVIMVGDGINDAAALSIADVGIAMGAGSDIALDAADFVLIRNDLIDAVSSVELGYATMRRIRGNLLWAFAYNMLGIPLALGILLPFTGFLLPPSFAAAAMALSSVSVVTNSLILRWWQPVAS